LGLDKASNVSNKAKNKPLLAHQGKLKLSFAAHSVAGAKTYNEDAWGVGAPRAALTTTKGIIATIADGVSHASQAAKASAYCVEQFEQSYFDAPQTWSSQHAISQCLASINSELFYQSLHGEDTSQHGQWLTTFSGIVFKSASAHIFHVGDTQILRISSAYKNTDKQFKIITTAHNHSLGNSSVLTRAVGADNHLKVDYQQLDIQSGDIFVLTCDGIHDHIDTDTMVAMITQSATEHLPSDPSPSDHLAQKIVAVAQANGSQDNLTCLLIKVEQVPQQQPDEIRHSLAGKTVPPALEVGQILEGYRVLDTFHASSRSHLYLVESVDDGQRYALKAPSKNFEEDEIYLQGFIHEAWVGAQIDSPLVMKVYPPEAEAKSKFLYHICEYIEGQTLRQWMIDHPKPGIDEVRQILKQIVAALRIFQRLQIVHRDLKPENLMIDSFGQIKLIDYGTASVAGLEEQLNHQSETHPLGTVNYTAPETLINLSSSYQSDLFSLGVIGYEMLTGQLPYPAQTRTSNQSRALPFEKWQYRSSKDHRSDIPFWLDLALKKALQANPEHRYQVYSEFLMDITKPNLNAEQEYKNKPLLERDPVKFWQIVSGLLAVWVVVLLVR
jgi:serine/threonine protein phosphatase PrpC